MTRIARTSGLVRSWMSTTVHTNPTPPGIPARGTYILPGTVGYLPSMGTPTTIVSQTSGTVGINGTNWNWTSDGILNCNVANPAPITNVRILAQVRYTGTGTLHVGFGGNGCIIDARKVGWTQPVTTGAATTSSTTLTLADGVGVWRATQANVGDPISGTGISGGTTITAVDPTSRGLTLTLSAAASVPAGTTVTLSARSTAFPAGAGTPLGAVINQGSGSHLDATDSTLLGFHNSPNSTPTFVGLTGDVTRCDLSMYPHTLEPASNSTVDSNWIHDPQYLTGEHADGVDDINGDAFNVTFQRNWIDQGPNYPASSITAGYFTQGPGNMASHKIYANYFNYHGLNGCHILNQQATMDVVNNVFELGADGYHGYTGNTSATLGAHSGNRYTDGSLVRLGYDPVLNPTSSQNVTMGV